MVRRRLPRDRCSRRCPPGQWRRTRYRLIINHMPPPPATSVQVAAGADLLGAATAAALSAAATAALRGNAAPALPRAIRVRGRSAATVLRGRGELWCRRPRLWSSWHLLGGCVSF